MLLHDYSCHPLRLALLSAIYCFYSQRSIRYKLPKEASLVHIKDIAVGVSRTKPL